MPLWISRNTESRITFCGHSRVAESVRLNVDMTHDTVIKPVLVFLRQLKKLTFEGEDHLSHVLVLNAAARVSVLASLHWLFVILLLVFKALHGLTPFHLCYFLSEYTSNRTLRSAQFPSLTL